MPPVAGAISRVIGVLEARARFQGGVRPVFVRTAMRHEQDGPANYLDLADDSGRAIEIRSGGWTVVENPGVEFRRPAGILPLPLPRADGSIELLKKYVNLEDRDFQLFVVWITAAMRPMGPYPPLVIQGEQGSAKSTLARVARLLVDPHSAPLLGEPASTRDLMATAVNTWLLTFDNVREVAPWLSDALCRLAVGGGQASRSLFTNDQVTYVYTQRPILLNGIDDIVTRGDLIDRSVFLYPRPIKESVRVAEAVFWLSFQEDYSGILGGLLDAFARGLAMLPSVVLGRVPRMADFAHWGEAVGRGLGWPENTFLTSYRRNRHVATVSAIEESMVANLVLRKLRYSGRWAGKFAALHAELTEYLDETPRLSAGWPKTTAGFAREFHRITPQLRMRGVSITIKREVNGRRVLIKTRNATEEDDM